MRKLNATDQMLKVVSGLFLSASFALAFHSESAAFSFDQGVDIREFSNGVFGQEQKQELQNTTPATLNTSQNKISIKVEIKQSLSTFESSNIGAPNYTYRKVTQNVPEVLSVLSDGALFGRDEKTFPEEEDTKVPGIDVKGHSFLTLEKAEDGRMLLTVDELVDDTADGLPLNSKVKYTAPVEFTNGTSWEEYVSGKDVELKFTENGRKIAQENTLEDMKSMLNGLREGIAAQMQEALLKKWNMDDRFKFEVSPFTIDKNEDKGEDLLRGNNRRLEWVGSPGEFQVSFTIALKPKVQ